MEQQTQLEAVIKSAARLDIDLSEAYWGEDKRTKRTHRLMYLVDQVRAIRRELDEIKNADAD